MTEDEFLRLPWEVTPQGGYRLTWNGKTAVISRAMTCSPTYGVTVDGVYTAHCGTERITELSMAKHTAYQLMKEGAPCTTK